MDIPFFRIILLSAFEPRLLARLIKQIQDEVPGAAVCGILYELKSSKTPGQRLINFVRNLPERGYLSYVGARLRDAIVSFLSWFGRAGLWLLHAYVPKRTDTAPFGLKELAEFCEGRGCTLQLTRDMHAPESLAFVRTLEPDLGIVYGTRILKPALFDIPRLGSINIHKRELPDYRGGGPIGLWEMLDGKNEIGVTVHRVTARLDAGAIIRSTTIPIEPYDTLRSLSLKADVVGADLLVRAVADFATGAVKERPQQGPARSYRTPSPQALRRFEKSIASQRPLYRDVRRRPTWKLLVRTLGLAPYVAVRNWYRRIRGSFPVIVLYHHLITDRPHPMGIPTDWFYRHVEYLRKYYRVADLVEALALAASGAVDAPTVALTFDDGYKDNYVNLRAVTEATGIPATLFICTDKIKTEQEFDHDLRLGVAGFPPLTWEEVRRLEASGLRIGSHTRSHFDCATMDRSRLHSEIAGSKADLESQLGHPVSCYSFPTGQPANVCPMALELAKTHYTHVCTTFGGANYPSTSAERWHVRRCYHPNTLWELELMLQSILEF
jgi:peptidoglycan/xylan/chitin deacetylase (PgdA/CDA1 family)/folate-dependent phosphoribosylglycinamide formyltransferase PurN